ncbi:MAG: redox-sensing transcriptional repressor Rex [Muribaculaceae bacterium]|nr:redox-sensing transcriptional repressor Rex [Muribaculaceae bacterium]MDD6943672.1 redox-sensing transcriptional repressor Rex [Bacteroidales bacterium]MDY2732773.1 redox-sensing transcriptional repressor Rex [Muribaculaceae bacterium]MDY4649463.1 redox-sensing transcriptional repressor Rex [Muribaculaceae bacterium]MDY5387845.1 redox-sensing transcriptional repressor Rex [Muribaculaceae bacterium]
MNQLPNVILPEPTLRRLPWYLAYVEILRHKKERYVSSTLISKALSVDASQIAKDLSFLGVKGRTRIGYEVEDLAKALSDFLGFSRRHKAYVIGVGSLGKALIRDSGLQNYGLEIIAGFDVNPEVISKKNLDVPIRHIDEIFDAMSTDPAEIAILTVPADVAQESADIAAGAGIRAIWNFTPYRVKVAEGVVMANTSIYAHLALIYTRLNEVMG